MNAKVSFSFNTTMATINSKDIAEILNVSQVSIPQWLRLIGFHCKVMSLSDNVSIPQWLRLINTLNFI